MCWTSGVRQVIPPENRYHQGKTGAKDERQGQAITPSLPTMIIHTKICRLKDFRVIPYGHASSTRQNQDSARVEPSEARNPSTEIAAALGQTYMIYVCIYIYIYTHTYICVCVYIYIYI